MLLATTNMMCMEVPAVPLLWILPLALYLLTFIIAFENDRWYFRPAAGSLFLGFAGWAMYTMSQGAVSSVAQQVGAYSGLAFSACLICHGELARSKPHPHYLTLFYLMLSLGGAMGGACVAIVCPLVFNGLWELPIATGAVLSLFALLVVRELPLGTPLGRLAIAGALAFLLASGSTYGVVWLVHKTNEATKYVARNFFGTLRVFKYHDQDWGDYLQLQNGNIDHGFQLLDKNKRDWPTSYYSADSGVGYAIQHHPKRLAGDPIHLGVIGLGTGTLAAYGQPGDTIRFYEINPNVPGIAQHIFTYLSDCPADKSIVLADARISLEREAERGELQDFDVLAIDAFSSDSIPMHLLTKECMEIYLKHLAPDGIIAFHISNRHLNLSPVVRALADEFRMDACRIENEADASLAARLSEWILVSYDARFIAGARRAYSSKWPNEQPQKLLWTDDFDSLWPILSWH
ncbi:MAG TPA: fused MFS/spermidine synthase [Pirellulales bacterium]|jgi:hypothetical protein|nr:fused MFS/spermidine synthase [Pirellulales bacterium]